MHVRPKTEENTQNEKGDTMDAETICRRSDEQTRPLLLRGGRGCVSYKNQSHLILSFLIVTMKNFTVLLITQKNHWRNPVVT